MRQEEIIKIVDDLKATALAMAKLSEMEEDILVKKQKAQKAFSLAREAFRSINFER